MKINNIEIDRLYYTKFIGVVIDQKLNWKEHIDLNGKKVSKSIAIIRKVKHFVNCDALLTLYNSIIYPYFTYCIEIWNNTYKTNIFSLFAKQKKIAIIICNANYLDHTASLYLKLNMLQFPDIVKYPTGIFMFKSFQNTLHYKIISTLASNQCCKTRGYEYNFYQKYVPTTKTVMHFILRCKAFDFI